MKTAWLLLFLSLLPLLAPAKAYAQNMTNTSIKPFEKAVSLADQVANYLKRIAYAVVIIAFFIGVIHWAFGRGPEWISRAVIAAFLISLGMWIIGYFLGG